MTSSILLLPPRRIGMMMNRNMISHLGLIIFGFISLQGCVWIDDNDDLVQFVTEIQLKPKRPIPALPEFEAYESFYYEGASLRNPFVPTVKFQSDFELETEDVELDLGNTPAPNALRIKAYLESFPLDDLVMVGSIAKRTGEIWALLVDKRGEIHRISMGDFLGLDHGKVIAVDAQSVKIIETVSNGKGGWIIRPRSIELTELKVKGS